MRMHNIKFIFIHQKGRYKYVHSTT